MTTLEQLAASWSRSYPRRASGGPFALSGFRFQLHSTLRELVLLASGASLPQPSLIAEKLSDLVSSREGGRIVVSQLKLTGSTSALRRALDDLWTVECVAKTEAPDLIDRISYEVRCGTWEISDFASAVGSWTPFSGSEAEIESFRSRVRAATDPHPLEDTLECLGGTLRVSNPLEWIDAETGRLLRLLADPNQISSIALEIYDKLAAIKNPIARAPSNLVVLGPSFREPENVTRGSILGNEQPRPRHVREGYLAAREWIVGPATAAVRAWMDADAFNGDSSRRVPLFWLGGRSGSGKSAALLQVAARLAGIGHGPIIWLGNRLDGLGHALEWAVKVVNRGGQPLLLLDDPYTPGDQQGALERWRQALALVDPLREDGERIPLLLACGPSEQGALLSRELKDDLVVERGFVVDDQLDVDHDASLRDWYERRTGRPAPASAPGNALLVQRFFEWRTGEPLEEFAGRFRSRVRSMRDGDAIELLIGQLLAVNQLYAGLPARTLEGLSPAAQDALARLKDERHLAVNSTSGRPGLWLAHPHLSHALFRGWFAPDAHRERAEVLKHAIQRSIAHGDSPQERNAPLWAVARAVGAAVGDPIKTRLDPRFLPQVLGEVYRQIAGTQGPSLSDLPVWIHLSNYLPGLSLVPRPDEVAASRLSVTDASEQTGARLTCHMLLGTPPDLLRGGEFETVRRLLTMSPRWREWGPIACDLVQRTRAKRDADMALDWVSRFHGSRSAPLVLETVLREVSSSRDEAARLATQLLKAASIGWERVAEAILEHGGCDLSVVLGWAQRHALSPQVPFVLAGLMKREVPASRALARSWIDLYPQSPVTNFLIEPLLRQTTPLEADIRAAERWIQPHLVGASHSIERLLELLPHDESERRERVIAVGSAWLEVWESHRQWPFVFQKLVGAMGRDARLDGLVRRGLAWVVGREDQPEWPFLIQKLLDVVVDETRRTELVALGVTWLEGRVSRPGWARVIQKLLDVVEDKEQRSELAVRGVGWLKLKDREDQPEWPFLIQKLLDVVVDETRRTELVALGITWLEGKEARREWIYVVQKMLDVVVNEKQRTDLVDRGLTWLDRRDDGPGCSHLIQKMLGVVVDETQRYKLVARGLTWLEGREVRREWTYVFEKLLDVVVDETQRSELVARGLSWLEGAEARPDWSHVVEALLLVSSDEDQRQRLVDRGYEWLLVGANRVRPQWKHMLLAVLRFELSSSRLEALVAEGVAWLVDNGSSSHWSRVLAKLLEVAQDAVQSIALVEQGVAWLHNNPHHPDTGLVVESLRGRAPNDTLRGPLIAPEPAAE